MTKSIQRIVTVGITSEQDVVLARQRARQIAGSLGFDMQDQTRIATAVSELARNAFEYARGGRVDFSLSKVPQPTLIVCVEDKGPGIRDLDRIMSGTYQSATGMGLGLIGAKRLMETFEVQTAPGKGTSVTVSRRLAPSAEKNLDLAKISSTLLSTQPVATNLVSELQLQNQELLRTLDLLRERQTELAQLNSELEDTNRGVVALYAELDDRAEYLRKASDIKTRFFSNISHELRTPLNSIVSLASILLDRIDGDLSTEQEKQVTYIKRSAEELIELVSDLLDLAKVEAGKISVRPQEFEVSTIFSALRGAIKPMLGTKPVELTFEDTPADFPLLNTDDTKVSQILRNFLSNALKFTDHGEVRVTARAEDEKVIFCVSDTGIGIPLDDQDKIFEEWSQVENPAQRRVKGSGLGLPLSRKLSELLGGVIWLESRPGSGSKFYLSIPRTYHGPSEVTLIGATTSAAEPPMYSVLIVEDNFETLYAYEKFLQGTEFRVLPAKNLREARNHMRDTRPSAILLDVLIEEETTWPFLQELHENPDTAGIPVIVATVVDNRIKAYSLGADDFAIKPIDRAWLIERLRKVVFGKPSKRLLVVDDDEVSRYSLMAMVGTDSFSFVEASTGREGLELAKKIHPDGIVLDLVMPEMSGLEVLQALRADPQTSHVPILVSTSKRLTENERKLIESNSASILPKGKPREDVIKTVQKVFGGISATA
ncbi:MAG TPA: ATP-binding protein [Terriglobales bacterium]|nr:ATP-binding protein [Terriglobales bacterium]